MAKSVIVRIIQGRNLMAADSNGLSDPYCRVFTTSTEHHKKHFTTHVQKKTLTPQWGESFGVPISTETENLIFEVMDKDLVIDDHIGKAFCSLKNLSEGAETVFWLPLAPYQGEIEIGLTPKGFSTFKPPKAEPVTVTTTTTSVAPVTQPILVAPAAQPVVVVNTTVVTPASPVLVPLEGVTPAPTTGPVLVPLEGADAPQYVAPSSYAVQTKKTTVVNYTPTTTTSNYTYRRPTTTTTYNTYKPPRTTYTSSYHSTYHPTTTHHSTYHSSPATHSAPSHFSGGGGHSATSHAFRG